MKRGLIISNCQVQPLKHTLSLYCKDIVFEGFPVHLLHPGNKKQKIAELLAKRSTYDVILALPLSDDFEELSSARIASAFSGQKFVRIANMYFSGLHPDLTYIGGLSSRIESPIGDYHSKLALLAYTKGYGVSQTVELYNETVYELLGYFQEAEHSLAELERRENEVDVRFSDLVKASYQQNVTFFSVNHPTSFMFDLYCNRISRYLEENAGIERSSWGGGASLLVNHLASSSIFPVYPEIARRLQLSYPGSYAFKPTTMGDEPANSISLHEMVDGEFRAFDKFGKAALCESHQGRVLVQQFQDIDVSRPFEIVRR